MVRAAWVRRQPTGQSTEPAGVGLAVVVCESNIAPPRSRRAGVSRPGRSGIGLPQQGEVQTTKKRDYHRLNALLAAVVDHDDLVTRHRIRQVPDCL